MRVLAIYISDLLTQPHLGQSTSISPRNRNPLTPVALERILVCISHRFGNSRISMHISIALCNLSAGAV